MNYPYIGINKESGTIVLFSEENKGTYLRSRHQYLVGCNNIDGPFDESRFEIYRNKILLSNNIGGNDMIINVKSELYNN